MLTSWGGCEEAWEVFQLLSDLHNVFTTKQRDLHEIKPMGVKGGLLGLLYVTYLLNAAQKYVILFVLALWKFRADSHLL